MPRELGSAVPAEARIAGLGLMAMLLYIALSALAGWDPTWAGGAVPVWPAAGVAAGLLLISQETSRIVAVMVGSLVGCFISAIVNGTGIGAAAVVVAGQATELAVLTSMLAAWMPAGPPTLDHPRRVVAFLVTTVAASLAAALVVGFVLPLLGHAPSSFIEIAMRWSTSHAVGILVVAPACLDLASDIDKRSKLDASDLEAAIIFVLTTVLSYLLLVQSPITGRVSETVPLATLILLLVWAAARCRPLCVRITVLIIAFFTVLGLTSGVGIFAGPAHPPHDHIAAAQISILAVALCGLVLSALTSERRMAEAALVDAAQRTDLALSAGDTGTWSMDAETGTMDLDHRAREIWGIATGARLVNALIEGHIAPEDAERRRRILHRALDPESDGVMELEYKLEARNGRPERWIALRGRTHFAAGKATKMIGTVRDITARRISQDLLVQHEAALQEEIEERSRTLEAVLDTAVTAIITIDTAGRMRTANAATTQLFGYSLDELLGQNVSMLMPEPDAGRHDGYIESYLSTGQRKIIGIGREVEARRKDGSTFPIHLAVSEFEVGGAARFSGIVTDLTERAAAEAALRESERQLAQAQKLEAVGQLTEGIAHDFNNILTVITGNLELIGMQLEDERCRDMLRRADEAARMGARLTGRLSSFSRRRASQSTELDLNDMAIGMTELIRRALGESISVTTELMPGLWTVNADPSEIENAILNLAINARDAMPKGGRIAIKTLNVSLSAHELAASPHATPGDFVMISVADNGSGMPPEVLARAFEPFFTTKEPSRGTGLGLATIYGFVRRARGHVAVDSAVGRGTIVRVYLPRSTKRPSSTAAGTGSAPPAPVPGALVLIVEDSEAIRELAVRRLRLLGYETLTAESGARAIELLEQEGKIDAVFSDVVMPGGVSGFELADWLARHRPEVPILLTSGFAAQPEELDRRPGQPPRLLAKPYTQADLAQALRELMLAARK